MTSEAAEATIADSDALPRSTADVEVGTSPGSTSLNVSGMTARLVISRLGLGKTVEELVRGSGNSPMMALGCRTLVGFTDVACRNVSTEVTSANAAAACDRSLPELVTTAATEDVKIVSPGILKLRGSNDTEVAATLLIVLGHVGPSPPRAAPSKRLVWPSGEEPSKASLVSRR